MLVATIKYCRRRVAQCGTRAGLPIYVGVAVRPARRASKRDGRSTTTARAEGEALPSAEASPRRARASHGGRLLPGVR